MTMQLRNIPGLAKSVSRLVQGCMMLDPEHIDEDFKLLDAVYDAGFRAFDSSHIYGGGKCDQVLGKWVADRGVRPDIVLMDKCCHPAEDRNRVTPECIAEDLRFCLDNLGFDHIDIFAFHRDDPQTPVGELVEAMNEHINAGTIGAWGMSNWGFGRIREAFDYAQDHNLVAPAVVSPHYSLAIAHEEPWPGCRSITGPGHQDEIDFYRENQTPVFNWSSLCGGFFSGRFRRDNLDEFVEYLDKITVRCYCRQDNFRKLDRVRELAGSLKVSLPQVVLAWILNGPLNCFPLVACWKPEQAYDNAKACDLVLTRQQMESLE